MSSKPSTEGVRKLRETLARIEALEKRDVELRRLALEHEQVRHDLHAAQRQYEDQMRAMDVHGGNAGWEGRTEWMLRELLRQERDK